MEAFIAWLVLLAAWILIIYEIMNSVLRTRSGLRWIKGYHLNKHMEQDEILNLLKSVQYPEKVNAFTASDGKMWFETKRYQYPVEVFDDKSGSTTIGFLVKWSKVSKLKKKKVAYDLDNLYRFLKETAETGNSEKAMKAYEKNKKILKLIHVDVAVLCIGIILVLIMS